MKNIMKIDRYLYLKDTGACRMTVNKNATEAGEIRFRLEIEVPMTVFRKNDPVIHLSLPEKLYDLEDQDIATITAYTIAEKIDIDVKDITDDLLESMRRKKERNAID